MRGHRRLVRGSALLAVLLVVSFLLQPAALAKQNDAATRHPSGTKFSGEEIYRGLFFGQGPVAKLFPEVWRATPSPAQQQKVAQFADEAVKRIRQKDPTFFDRFGVAMQSGQRVLIMEHLKQAGTLTLDVFKEAGHVPEDAVVTPTACGAVAVCVAAVAVALWKYAAVVDVAVGGAIYYLAVAVQKYTSTQPDSRESQLQVEMLVNDIAVRLASSH